jgi:hypothetical protein
MVNPIGKILGLFKAGESGAGGQFQPLDKIDAYVWKMNQCRLVYGVAFANMVGDLVANYDAVIIDILYDGVCQKDTHLKDPMIFVTNYPGEKQAWFAYFTPPSYSQYLAPGVHTVKIQIAPRKLCQILRGRDFSTEAGGVTAEFQFTVTGDGSNTFSG